MLNAANAIGNAYLEMISIRFVALIWPAVGHIIRRCMSGWLSCSVVWMLIGGVRMIQTHLLRFIQLWSSLVNFWYSSQAHICLGYEFGITRTTESAGPAVFNCMAATFYVRITLSHLDQLNLPVRCHRHDVVLPVPWGHVWRRNWHRQTQTVRP